MRVWLDDVRPMPPGYDVHVKTPQEAIGLIKSGKVTKISLDHDLGMDNYVKPNNGYDVACYLEEVAYYGLVAPIKIHIHTDNPVGREKMKAAVRKAYISWKLHALNNEGEL